MSKLTITAELIQTLLPCEPEGYLGYKVERVSHMWHAIYLLHPPYSYKEGVRTIYGYVKSTGVVYRPGHNRKPSSDIVCSVLDLFKQNCYTTIKPQDNPTLRRYVEEDRRNASQGKLPW